jgi:hypothetical protein
MATGLHVKKKQYLNERKEVRRNNGSKEEGK